jgi:hypothetical protein
MGQNIGASKKKRKNVPFLAFLLKKINFGIIEKSWKYQGCGSGSETALIRIEEYLDPDPGQRKRKELRKKSKLCCN